ncbi:MAG TPA: vanadium-dependent haloperoxidase [Chitinophagaceae bacterium]|nr:vanadium-dependent haloperoxidase [Chitinophagaceae bacterium]
MRKKILFAVFIATSLFIVSCQKQIDKPHQPNLEESTVANQNSQHGHLNQTKEYSSEVVLKWMDMQLRVIRTTAGMPPPTNSRLFAYSGIALYESVVPGMPAYQSLSGQLTDMPDLPQTSPGFAYHWAASANAALALMTKEFFPTTSFANKASIDSLENALNDVYKTQVNAETFNRSTTFGKAVAQLVFDWSETDGANHAGDPYALPVGLGLWVPTYPNNPAASTPYWGRNRLFDAASLNNSQPTLPPAYSTDPSSTYYKNMEEVYNVSQSLTAEQTATGLYYRDNPGYVSGGHYLSILYQVLQIENPTLDFSAVAFAKSGIAIADALIGCFQWKYKDVNGGPVTSTERPVTFIRNVMGKDWNTLFGTTPPHPDFPSGHSSTAGAAEVVFTHLFGENYALTNHTYDYLNMPPQSYTSFSDMAEQIGLSRLYAGIHTRYACDVARIMGNKIAQNILNDVKFLKE